MFKKIIFLFLFSLFLHAEPVQLVGIKKGKLYFKDGSIYLMNRESERRFPKNAIGKSFDIKRLEKSARKRAFDTAIDSRLGSFKAKRISDKHNREIKVTVKQPIQKPDPVPTAVRNVREKSPQPSHTPQSPQPPKAVNLSVVFQHERILKLSDGTSFVAHTLLPNRNIEGEDVVIEKVEFYQIKTKSGEKILLKQLRK